MNAKIQLNQFKRIQDHYQRELDTLTAELNRLNSQVFKLRMELRQIEERMESTELRLAPLALTVVDCRLGCRLLEKICGQRDQKLDELSQACEAYENQRTQVRQQQSRIKSLEKLVERKTLLVHQTERQRQQIVADDQFLNRSLSGSDQ